MTGEWTPRIGDRVVRNPGGWMPSEFDGWGAGQGVGVVVEPPWDHHVDGGVTEADCVPCVDVRWPTGTAVQRVSELLPADPEATP